MAMFNLIKCIVNVQYFCHNKIYAFHPSSSLYVLEMLAVAACVSLEQFIASDRESVHKL